MPRITLHHCNICDKDLPVEAFSKNKAYASGLQNRCKKCMREYRKGHYSIHGPELRDKATRQRATNGRAPHPLLAQVLGSTPCIECSTESRPRHFKLREGPRSFNLLQARQIGVTESRLRLELQKYDVICEGCSPRKARYTDGYRELTPKTIEALDLAPAPKRGAIKRLVKSMGLDTENRVQQVPGSGRGGSSEGSRSHGS